MFSVEIDDVLRVSHENVLNSLFRLFLPKIGLLITLLRLSLNKDGGVRCFPGCLLSLIWI